MAPKKIKVKPGKTQSKMGFIVGILFVILGVFVVIPTFGLFGLMRAWPLMKLLLKMEWN